MFHSIGYDVDVQQILKPNAYAAGTHSSSSVDTLGFSRVLFLLGAGTNGASGTNDVKIQESDDDSTWTDVTGAAFTQITTSNDDARYTGIVRTDAGRKRYLRAQSVVATASCSQAVYAIPYDADDVPKNTPQWTV